MVRSTELIEMIQKSLRAEDWEVLGPVILELDKQQGRRARKSILKDLNNIIIDTSLKNNDPSLLSAIPDVEACDIEVLFSRITKQYIQTNDNAWLNSFLSLSEKLEKKSNQSRVFATIAKDLIDAGVTQADSDLISTGMFMLNRISFRKYRSEIMIDIVPLLIVWAITIRDKRILNTSLNLIKEIGDISKRSVLHAELVKALATIAILDKDHNSFIKSIFSTTEIHQKIRRQQCLSYILDKGIKSQFSKDMVDIPRFMDNFQDLAKDAYLEVISTLAGMVLERTNDKTQVLPILDELCRNNPSVTNTIVIDLLNKAERTGDPWYLSTAVKLLELLVEKEKYPVRELVRAGISVAKKASDMHILTGLIPIISNKCNSGALFRVYLQFAQIMLMSRDFHSALAIFGEIPHDCEELPQYSETLAQLLNEGVFKEAITPINQKILVRLSHDTVQGAIYRAALDISKEQSFSDIITHLPSFKELIALHTQRDHIIIEINTMLIERGFLDSHDPDILIRLAECIHEQPQKERAISNIVVKIAKKGVLENNRDFLQRAVGLTCEIDGQNTRSAALSSIIDEASTLAAQQGDLDLLLRMRVWSTSLLETNLAAYAMANIVDGVIKYAIDRQSPEALDEAFTIVTEIDDAALRSQLYERIAECFVKIGCTILTNPKYPAHDANLNTALHPFERGLEIIRQNLKTPQISLKIAGIIDSIISFSRISANPDFIIPLAMYSVEIENIYERDAMMSRIVANLSDDIIRPDSTDPYEIMAYLLQRNEGIKTYPIINTLIASIIERISDPYVKLTGLNNLLDTSIKAHESDRSRQIRKEICSGLPNLPAQYQKILILSDQTTIYSQTDPKIAITCIQRSIQLLNTVEFDKNELSRKQIIIALVSLHAADPRDEWIDLAFSTAQKIIGPVAYIQALISIYGMIQHNKDRCNEYLQNMITVADRIPSPYEKATTLLDIVPLVLKDSGDSEIPVVLLKKAEGLTQKINIPSIADTIRDNIAQVYTMLYTRHNDDQYLNHAIRITKTIDDDATRLKRYHQLGYQETLEVTPQYSKIRALSEKIIKDGIHPNQILSLERVIRTVADRGKESILFCDLAVYFKQQGEEKLSRKMIQNSVREARIIRPLSRRSFILCDIALKFYAAGCEHAAQETLDYAIDAATNIRQSSIRDDVFDELGHAIRIMQEM